MLARGWAENPDLVRKAHEVTADSVQPTYWPPTPKTGDGGPRTVVRLVRDDGQKLTLWLKPEETASLHSSLGKAVAAHAKRLGQPTIHPAVEAIRKRIAQFDPSVDDDEESDFVLNGLEEALAIVEKVVGA